MLPTTDRSHRSTIPATGLGSILVVVPQLALAADRGVVAELAVAVGMGEGEFSAVDRRPWADVAATGDRMPTGTPGIDPAVAGPARGGRATDTTTAAQGIR